MAIIGVGIYSIEAGGCNVFDSHARDMFYNSHSERTCVLLEMLEIVVYEMLIVTNVTVNSAAL